MLNRFFKKIQFKNKQRAIAKQTEETGLTDELLEEQVALNMLRNEHDISDSKNRVYKKYVQ